jgi:hypothetical protein
VPLKSALLPLSFFPYPCAKEVPAPAKALYGVLLNELLAIVRDSNGMPSFFVRRIEAEVA